jgi:hypothetical protein
MVDSGVNLQIASLTFSVLSFLVMVIGLILIFVPSLRQMLTGMTSGVSSTGSAFLDNLKIAGLLGGALSPDIVLLIGFISDLMNLNFRYSVTSIVGVLAVVLHWLIGGALFGFSKGLTTAVASTASAVTSAVTQPAPTGPQLFGVGDPTAPTVTPPPPAAPPAPASPAGVLGAIAKPQRQAAAKKPTMATGNKPPRRPGSVSTAPDMGEPATATTTTGSRTVSFARPTRAAATKSSDATSKLAANKQLGGALPSYISEKFNPCAIRGLGFFDIQGSPMGMAALSAIFMIYLLDMAVGNKRSGAQIGGYVGFSVAVFALNVYAYRELKCVNTTSMSASFKSLALPLGVGLLSGTTAYFVMKNNYANFLPLDGTHFDDGTGHDSSNNAPRGDQPHCSAPSDDGAMVCEAYRDGKRVT